MTYFALGHTSLTSFSFIGADSGNHTFEFQADTGSGFGAWQTLNNTNLAAVGAIAPSTGVSLKVRATCSVASSTNSITYLTINTGTDAVSQETQYPLPLTPITITVIDISGNPIQNARVYLEAGAGGPIAQGTILLNQLTDINGVAYAADYNISSNQPTQKGRVRKGPPSPIYKAGNVVGTIPSTGFATTITLIADE
jgi:hypothetical protein